jgi:hypothetical protein
MVRAFTTCVSTGVTCGPDVSLKPAYALHDRSGPGGIDTTTGPG